MYGLQSVFLIFDVILLPIFIQPHLRVPQGLHDGEQFFLGTQGARRWHVLPVVLMDVAAALVVEADGLVAISLQGCSKGVYTEDLGETAVELAD